MYCLAQRLENKSIIHDVRVRLHPTFVEIVKYSSNDFHLRLNIEQLSITNFQTEKYNLIPRDLYNSAKNKKNIYIHLHDDSEEYFLSLTTKRSIDVVLSYCKNY